MNREELMARIEENERAMKRAKSETAMAVDQLKFCEDAEYYLDCERVSLDGELEELERWWVTKMNNKIWCEECKGTGLARADSGHIKRGWYVPRDAAPVDTYTITDAQADAAVLGVINREFEFEYGINGYKPDQRLNKISDSILDRLHAFYCGEGEK